MPDSIYQGTVHRIVTMGDSLLIVHSRGIVLRTPRGTRFVKQSFNLRTSVARQLHNGLLAFNANNVTQSLFDPRTMTHHGISREAFEQIWQRQQRDHERQIEVIRASVPELRNTEINQVYRDSKGNYWVATEQGLYFIQDNGIKLYRSMNAASDKYV